MTVRAFFRLIILLSLLWLALPGLAQTASPTPSPTASDKVTELRDKLQEVQRRLEEAPEGAPFSVRSVDPEAPPGYVDSLQRYDVNLRRLITLEQGKARIKTESEQVSEAIKEVSSRGLDVPKPYTVALLDGLQSELDVTGEKLRSARLATNAAKTSEDLESQRLSKLQALRRRLLDRLNDSPGDVELKRRVENAMVAIEAAQSGVDLAQAELETSKLEQELAEKRQELLQLKIQLVQDSFRFSESTLQTQLDSLEADRDQATERLKSFKKSEEVSSQRLNTLLEDGIPDSEQVSEIAARQEWVTTHQRKRRLLEEKLEYILSRRDLWEWRYLTHQNQGSTNYSEWLESTRGLLNRLNKSRQVLDTELTQIRGTLSGLLNNEEESEQELDRWREIQIQALVNRQKAIEDLLAYHKETASLAKRLQAELTLQDQQRSLGERAGDAWGTLVDFWNIELYTMGDSAVTVGKLCVAVTVLILGLGFVGRFTKFLSARLIRVLPIRENVKANLERFLRYFLILLVFLFSLHVVNIPLTIFTFLGGTLAIAVGFGAQNILNNFISGLILMVERPVRAGDMVEVDDTLGVVEEIGARSTRVRIPTGIHVILPNSVLLENKVVNWTLEDSRIRTKVSVGVAYGSSPQQVIDLVSQAANDVNEVLKNPGPIVTFDDFADSSLNFTVHFWVAVATPMDRDRVCTKVRIHIDELFKEHNISIPFPQRDLNFHEPVPVRIVSEKEQES